MTDVLIVGSGPTGLTLACDLALRGIAVRVLDGRSGPHRESRGKGLVPSSLEVFARLGAAERMAAIGTRGVILRKYFDGAHINDTPTGDGLLIGQWQVEEALRELLMRPRRPDRVPGPGRRRHPGRDRGHRGAGGRPFGPRRPTPPGATAATAPSANSSGSPSRDARTPRRRW